MSNKSRRRPNLPPRPNVIPEQLRHQITQQVGLGSRTFDRAECIQFIGMWTGNLAKRINADPRIPWLTASIQQKPADAGLSLHVQVINHTDDEGALTATGTENVRALPTAQAPQSRTQSIKLVNQLAASQQFLLDSKKQMPWLNISMERRSDGFSLNIDILEAL